MVPIYEQIVDQIKMLIRNGELKENDNLPSVRTLSKELKISALTVKKGGQNNERLIRKRFEIDDVTEKFSVAHFGDCNRNDDIY